MTGKILPESTIESILREEIRRQGGLCYKWVSPGQKGVPDRIVITKQHGVQFVELKRADGRPRPDQVRQIKKLRAQGQMAMTVAGLAGLKNYFLLLGYDDSAARIDKRLKKGEC